MRVSVRETEGKRAFAASRSRVTDGLDVVAVGIQHEGAEVFGVIFGTQAGATVVSPARVERGAMERLDHGAIAGREGDVKHRAGRPLLEPERRLAAAAEARAGDRVLEQQLVAERRERAREELLAALVVRDADAEVVDHGASSGG